MNFDAAPRRVRGVSPRHGVVPHDGAGFVIERAHDGVAHVIRKIELRTDPGDLVRKDQLGPDAEMLVDFRPPPAGAQGRIGVREREVAPLGVEDVVVQLVRQIPIEPHRFVVEADAFGREVVRADDGGVSGRIATRQVSLLQDGDVGDAVFLGEIVGSREPVPAAADDDDVVRRLELGCDRNVAAGGVAPPQTVFQQAERHGPSGLTDGTRTVTGGNEMS